MKYSHFLNLDVFYTIFSVVGGVSEDTESAVQSAWSCFLVPLQDAVAPPP